MKKELIQDYAWILRGSQRRKIIRVMNKPKTPTLLKEETKIKVSNTSDVLRAMVKRKMARCINPKDKLGRLYQLTNKGREVRKEIIEE